MSRYICSVCGFTYDEDKGMPEAGIAPGTKWEDLPESWTCPICGASKAEFEAEAVVEKVVPAAAASVASSAAASTSEASAAAESSTDLKELTSLEASILCSNLARGCEKQYKSEEQALFTELADYFKSVAPAASDASFASLLARVEADLASDIPAAKAAAVAASDRGSLRALTWCDKVTHILKSLLERYEKEGDAMLENTGIYVCTICGFIYVGDNPPEFCPVCKVPSWKFKKIEGGVA